MNQYAATVYFVRLIGTNQVKIGYTANLRQRLIALTTYGNVELVHKIKGDRKTEKLCHQIAAKHRTRLEWFELTNKQITDIAKKAKEDQRRIKSVKTPTTNKIRGINLRVSDQLYKAMESLAEKEGLLTPEWVRARLREIVFDRLNGKQR